MYSTFLAATNFILFLKVQQNDISDLAQLTNTEGMKHIPQRSLDVDDRMMDQCTTSAIRWSAAPEALSEHFAFERISLINCTEKTTWSAWADEQGNLVQGFVTPELAGDHEILLPSSADRDPHNDKLSANGYKLLGPALALFLCTMSFVYLYRRRNMKHLRGDHTISLAEHPEVPLSAKILVPLFLFVTVGLFSFSNAVIGAKVTMEADVFSHQVLELSLFDFSLVNTITDMWKAKVYPLAALVAIWSGLWPYLKCLLMLAAWFIPPTALKPAHRRRLLIAMDMLGKWALLDLFLMNMMTIAFRFHITVATIRFIPKNMIAVDVKVTPQTGLFTFVTAVALSLIVNHVILAFHRNIVSSEEVDDGRRGSSFHLTTPMVSDARTRLLEASEDEEEHGASVEETFVVPQRYCINFPKGSWFDTGSKEAADSTHRAARRLAFTKTSIVGHRFTPGTIPSFLLSEGTKQFHMIVRWMLVLGGAFVLCLIIACAVEDTFEFVFTGLAGKAIQLVDPEQLVRRASLMSIANGLGKDKEAGQAFGIFYLQSLYLLFSFVFPLVVLLMSLVMMFARFTLRQAKMFFYALEIATAWAALDVFIVAIIASVMQINQFSHFLEGPYCDPLKKYLHVKECFGVETQLLKGCWLIVAASCCFWCFVQFVQRTAERAIADREEMILEFLNN